MSGRAAGIGGCCEARAAVTPPRGGYAEREETPSTPPSRGAAAIAIETYNTGGEPAAEAERGCGRGAGEP